MTDIKGNGRRKFWWLSFQAGLGMGMKAKAKEAEGNREVKAAAEAQP